VQKDTSKEKTTSADGKSHQHPRQNHLQEGANDDLSTTKTLAPHTEPSDDNAYGPTPPLLFCHVNTTTSNLDGSCGQVQHHPNLVLSLVLQPHPHRHNVVVTNYQRLSLELQSDHHGSRVADPTSLDRDPSHIYLSLQHHQLGMSSAGEQAHPCSRIEKMRLI
jgi:hypothetical protein